MWSRVVTAFFTVCAAFTAKRGLPARPLAAAARRRTAPVVNMNMFERFKRVAKANMNNVLGKRVARRPARLATPRRRRGRPARARASSAPRASAFDTRRRVARAKATAPVS